MKKVLVVGLNNFGKNIACTLANKCEVVAGDYQKEKLANVEANVRNVLLLDREKPEQLNELNYRHIDFVIVVFREDVFFSMAVIVVLKQLEAKNIYVCVENEDQEKMIALLGDVTIIRSDVQVTNAVMEKISSGPVATSNN